MALHQVSTEQFEVYTPVIKRVLADSEYLPSLPAITLEIRQAVSDQNTTSNKLASMIRHDPGLSALLVKYASNPLYRTVEPVKTLPDIISHLGFSTIGNLVMMHSFRSMFVMKQPLLKKLFNRTWKRQIMRAGLSFFLAKRLGYRPADEVIVASLLTEIGSLAVLSAFKDMAEIPNEKTYVALCRHYSKRLGATLLTKWNVDAALIDVVKQSGKWRESPKGPLALVDFINLSLYHTILWSNSKANLPGLEEIAAYKKIPSPDNAIQDGQGLLLVADHRDQVDQIVSSLS